MTENGGGVSDRAAAFRIFAFLATLYLATFGGHLYTGDGIEMEKTAESLALRGDLALTRDVDGRQWGYPGPDGRRYSPYALGLSVLEAPFIAAAHAGASLLHLDEKPARKIAWAAAMSVNVFVTAATAALLFLLLAGIGETRRVAAGGSLLYGLGTMAWVYSRHDFAEPLAALALLATVHFMLRAMLKGSDGAAVSLVVAGLWNGVSFFTKYQMVLDTPIFLAFLIGHPRFRERGPSGLARNLILFLGPGLPFGILNLLVNHARFGTWLETGYANQGEIFAGWGFLPIGLFGLLLSTGKGLFWYSPVLLAAPFAWRAFHARHREASLLCASLAAATLFIFAPLWWWHGDWAWGPRYLVVVLPLMVAPISAWLGDRGRVSRGLIVLVCLALLVNFLGLSVNFVYYLVELKQMGMVHDDWNFIPGLSPIRFHAHVVLSNALSGLGLGSPDFVYRTWSDGVLEERVISMATLEAAGREPDYFFFRPRESALEVALFGGAGLLLLAAAAFQGRAVRRLLRAEDR